MTSQSSYTCTMNFSRARLRGHRDGLGLSQGQVATRCNLSRHEIGHLEMGLSTPSEDVIVRLAAALGVPTTALETASPSYSVEYIDAALSHVQPLSDGDITRAVAAMRPETQEEAR